MKQRLTSALAAAAFFLILTSLSILSGALDEWLIEEENLYGQ